MSFAHAAWQSVDGILLKQSIVVSSDYGDVRWLDVDTPEIHS